MTACVIVTVAVSACDAGRAPEPPTPLAEVQPPAQKRGDEAFIWTVGGKPLATEIISAQMVSGSMVIGAHFVPIHGTSYVVRVTDGDQRFDVYSTKLGKPSLRQHGDDLFMEATATGLGEPPEGETHSYEATLVRWDTGQDVPVVVHEWKCTTSSRPRARDCVTPSWVNEVTR